MKNLFLSTAFALLSVASFAQGLTRSLTEPITALCDADSIMIFKLSGGCLDTNPKLFGDIDYGGFQYDLVAVYGAKDGIHTWDDAGVYSVICTQGYDVVNRPTVFIINDDYVNTVAGFNSSVVLGGDVYSNTFEYVGTGGLSIISVD